MLAASEAIHQISRSFDVGVLGVRLVAVNRGNDGPTDDLLSLHFFAVQEILSWECDGGECAPTLGGQSILVGGVHRQV